MGSSYSDLYLYFKRKKDENNTKENGKHNGGQQNNNNQKYSITVSKSNYQGCVNFEKVTHTIKFTPPNKGTNYNIILNDSCEKDKDKGKNVFGYYYPSTNNVVLKELHVYYSVLDPNDPLVVSFVTHGEQTYNFTYSGLISTRWVRAYSIAYYSLGQDVSSELLTNEFRKSHRNRKIKFETGKNVVQVSGNKQELDKETCYRYIFYPNGNTSVLGSECLNNIKIDTSLPECPDSSKSSESAKPPDSSSPAASATQSAAPASTANQSQSNAPNYDNKIDPYYLDFVNGHHYDGVILYFVKNGNQRQDGTSGGASSSPQGNGGTSNASGQGNSEKYDHNMAVLLELIDNCNIKTHIQRKDKLGNWWTQGEVKYNNDKELIEQLKKIKETACKEDSTTFILDNKKDYKGVQFKLGDTKTTYKKYTHTATTPNKPNVLFRKKYITIGKYSPDNDKTKSLDVYFLKIGDNEQGYPFIIMITNVDEKASGTSAGSATAQPQHQQPQQPGNGTQGAGGGSGAAASQAQGEKKECKKCYFSSENYKFEDWQELKYEKKPETSEKTKKEKTENEQDKLQDKLEAKLAKIEDYGKCTKDINILRSIAYQVLIGKDDPDTTKSATPEPVEQRPELKPYRGDIGGTSLPVVLGSVAAGLVVLGIIGAIIYGIYWYNTTIKLLT